MDKEKKFQLVFGISHLRSLLNKAFTITLMSGILFLTTKAIFFAQVYIPFMIIAYAMCGVCIWLEISCWKIQNERKETEEE